jgi:hypothetical protein
VKEEKFDFVSCGGYRISQMKRRDCAFSLVFVEDSLNAWSMRAKTQDFNRFTYTQDNEIGFGDKKVERC